MNISSLLIHAAPDRLASVSQKLAALPGVELFGKSEDGRLIATVEPTPDAPMADTVIDLHNIDGVLSASLVYHYCDDADRVEEDDDEAK